MKNHLTAGKVFLALSVFIGSLQIGFFLADHRPLWTDEFYTQTGTISETYQDILLGQNVGEGSLAPLFYIQQKLFCDIFHFETPRAWRNGDWSEGNKFADIFLRVFPIFWVSLFFLVVFLYFSSRFNIWFGFLSLLVAYSSPLLWSHWAEARPYGLWVLLTGCQMILFLMILEEKNVSNKKWSLLSLTHVALSLTCILSAFQILIVSVILLIKERRWYKYIFLTLLPVAFIIFYRSHSAPNDVIFSLTIEQMIRDAIARDRLYILLLYPLMLGVYCLQTRKLLPKIFNDDALFKAFPFFLSIFFVLCAVVLFLNHLQMHATGQGQYVVSRHIIFLTPVGIIAVSYLAGVLWQSLRVPWWSRFVAITAILLFLLYRLPKVIVEIRNLF